MDENKNTGVIDIPPSHLAWLAAGGDTGIIYQDNRAPWRQFQGVDRLQAKLFETFTCVTCSGHFNCECYGNMKVRRALYTKENIQWLHDNGYFDASGSLHFSDRFNAILSGTTREGNWQEKVAESRRVDGLIPDTDLPYGGSNFDQYMDPKVITPAMITKGKEFLKRFKMPYQFVLVKAYGQDVFKTLSYYVKQAPIQCTSPVCPGWSGNIAVKSCPSIITQHATSTCEVLPTYFDEHDQYNPFWKQLAADYPLLYGLMQLMEEVTPVPVPTPGYHFAHPLAKGAVGQDVIELQKILVVEGCLNPDFLTTSIAAGGIFGPATLTAVIKFQNKYAANILTPVGLHMGTGFVGASTLAYLNSR